METLEIIKFSIVLLGSFLGIWARKWIITRWKHFRDSRQAVNNAQNVINLQVVADLKTIKGQIFPNDGNSMFDKVTRIETKQKEIEGQVIDLKIRQRNSSEIQEAAIFESDHNGYLTYVSRVYCELVDNTENNILGNSWKGLIESTDRSRVVSEWNEAINTASEFTCEFNFKRGDGQLQAVKATAIHNKSEGKVVASLGILHKVGEPFKK